MVKIKPVIISILLITMFTGFSTEVTAQFYNGSQLTFGKNRVQHSVGRYWLYFKYEAFDAYYYQGGRDMAIYTARYAMEAIPEIENRLDYKLEDKIQFIIFNNLSDLKESNIGLLSDEHYNIGGITYIVGTKVFIYFDGSYESLERQIRLGLAEVILNEMLYGSQITTQMKNSTLIHLPEWYTFGLISWLADDWSTTIDNMVRDGIVSGRYKNFNGLSGQDAIYAGHSIWKYINDKYGMPTISNIVYMTKVSRQVENGFLFVIGLSFQSMADEWKLYYIDSYYSDDNLRNDVNGTPFPVKQKKEMIFQQLTLSPDGNYAAWVSNQSGKYKIMVYDRTTGKTKKIIRRGNRLDEKADLSYPLLTWHPNSQLLAFITEEKGLKKLYYYTLYDKELSYELITDFQKITDFSFSPNGEQFVMAAVLHGQSDIFLYNRSSRSYQHITKDIYDDIHPVFIDNGKKVIFSSNRPHDTLMFDLHTARIDTHKVIDKQAAYDLFVYNLRTKSALLWQITNTPHFNETAPLPYDNGHISYLSDENGINNRFIARFDSSIAFIDTITHYRYFTESFPVTNYRRNILYHHTNKGTGEIAEIVFEEGKYLISSYQLPFERLPDERVELIPTEWRKQHQRSLKKTIDTMLPKKEPKEIKSGQEQIKRRFITVKKTDTPPPNTDSAAIDIKNYDFGQDADSTIISRKTPEMKTTAKDVFYIPKDRSYKVEFSINKLISQVDFTYINSSYQQFTGTAQPIFINPGINAFLQVGITDLFEDYRLTGGVRLSATLNNNEYFLSYENLKKRLDKQIVLHRKTLENYTPYSYIKRYSHEAHYILKYPFSNVFAMRNSAILRLDKSVYQSTDFYNLQLPDEYDIWLSGRSELVFDNTRERGVNTYFGTRGKVFGEYYLQADNLKENMIVVGGDLRHYLQLHRTFIWANRIAASTSFGKNLLMYYMGGVDNWLFPKFNEKINIDLERQWRYQTLATNMRGFTQNIRNGNSFVVINSELRFPLFKYFANKPLKSLFLNNFQLIAFGDIGTAWTGPSPYSEDNALYTQIVEQGPIKLIVKRQVEPIVGGFGGGVRSTLLGYFLRIDYAWGIEDGTIQKPVFYLSLSLDF